MYLSPVPVQLISFRDFTGSGDPPVVVSPWCSLFSSPVESTVWTITLPKGWEMDHFLVCSSDYEPEPVSRHGRVVNVPTG